MLRDRILIVPSWIFLFLKNWTDFDFYEQKFQEREKFHVRKVKCLVRSTDRKMSVWRMEASDDRFQQNIQHLILEWGQCSQPPESCPNGSLDLFSEVPSSRALSIQQNSGLKFHVTQLSHYTFGNIVLASRIQKSGTGESNFLKWEGTFWSNLLKWLNWSKRTIIKAGSEYSGQIKPKWSFPCDNIPTKNFEILGWMESATNLWSRL